MASNVSFVVYPESCNIEYALQEIANLYSIEYSYILHDIDTNELGELKKPHYHLNLTLTWNDSKHCSKERENLRKILGGALVQNISNLTGAVRYLVHLDDKEKAQYKIENIVFGGSLHKQRLIQSIEYNSNDKDANTCLEDLFNYIDNCPILPNEMDIFKYLRKNRLFFKLSPVLKYVFMYLEYKYEEYEREQKYQSKYKYDYDVLELEN